MARPRSEDKRNAILDAAIQVIAVEGVSAPTAKIAKMAGVAARLRVVTLDLTLAAVSIRRQVCTQHCNKRYCCMS
jgi:hypothetical protein